jgi:hypothetical protein
MAPTQQQKAKIMTPAELGKIRYPLSDSWKKAAGLLKHKRKALEQHLTTIRNEWDRHSSQK